MIHSMALALSLMLPLSTQDATPQSRPGIRAQARAYDPATEAAFQGTVEEVKTLPMGRFPGVHLMVNAGGKMIEARLGPSFFLEENKAAFAKGDKVSFTGSRVGETVIVREITCNGATLELRDKRGIPVWSRGRRRF